MLRKQAPCWQAQDNAKREQASEQVLVISSHVNFINHSQKHWRFQLSAEWAPLWPLGFIKGMDQLVFTVFSERKENLFISVWISYLAIFPSCFVVLGKFPGGMNASQPPSFSSHLSDGERGVVFSRWESYQPRLRNFPGLPMAQGSNKHKNSAHCPWHPAARKNLQIQMKKMTRFISCTNIILSEFNYSKNENYFY